MTINEIKHKINSLKNSEPLIRINGISFSSEFDFDFSEKYDMLCIRFNSAGIRGIIASIDYDEIKSIE